MVKCTQKYDWFRLNVDDYKISHLEIVFKKAIRE